MGQSYLITGVNRGIGLELARQLAARGDTVLGTAREPETAAEAAKVVSRLVRLDVTDPAALAALGAALGDAPIDVLINNAGVSSSSKTLADCTAQELQRVFMVNSTAPILVAQAALDLLAKGKRKLIVNVTSQLGSISTNTGGSSYAYRASKAALNMLTRSMANELGPRGFICVALHPGWVRTDMGGANAPLVPARAVAALLRLVDRFDASDNGRFLNFDGTTLPW
ncbi:MAG: SDR family oxidoreductase [Planctomycetes bacterium]|nr:SDR family oxidoreductase [Planctomycetota bacterium]